MCLSTEKGLLQLVTKPIHSITNQTFDSKLRFPSSRPFNADGFGIGYYEPPAQASSEPDFSIEDQQANGDNQSEEVDAGSEYDAVIGRDNGNTYERSHEETTQAERQEVQIGAEKVTGSDRVRRKLELAAIESERPGLFKSIHPVSFTLLLCSSRAMGIDLAPRCATKAWSNANLIRLAEKIRSPLVFAHVRASTMPGARRSNIPG